MIFMGEKIFTEVNFTAVEFRTPVGVDFICRSPCGYILFLCYCPMGLWKKKMDRDFVFRSIVVLSFGTWVIWPWSRLLY